MSAAPTLLRLDVQRDSAGAGALRWVRAAVVALTATGLALLWHMAAGGSPPAPRTLIIVGIVVTIVSFGLSARRWTLGPLLAMLLGSQALFHVVFGAGATATAGHMHHVGDPAAMAHHGPVMLAGHVAAALVTALLLRRGDDCVWRFAELLTRAWRAARIVVEQRAPGRARGIGLATAAEMPAALHLLEHALDRRGPPRRAAA